MFIEYTPHGVKVAGELVSFDDAAQQLDNGAYDQDLPNGMRIVAEIVQAQVNRDHLMTSEQNAQLWRWIIACVFSFELKDKNGVESITQDDGSVMRVPMFISDLGGMAIYPSSERFALAHHIESVAIEKYGLDAGLERAIMLYQGMVEEDEKTGRMVLSKWGRDSLDTLHNHFLSLLNSGNAKQPTTH